MISHTLPPISLVQPKNQVWHFGRNHSAKRPLVGEEMTSNGFPGLTGMYRIMKTSPSQNPLNVPTPISAYTSQPIRWSKDYQATGLKGSITTEVQAKFTNGFFFHLRLSRRPDNGRRRVRKRNGSLAADPKAIVYRPLS